ncbi:UDP-glucose 4-epimerase GalE [bacterium]|nr:UDP-glucose 4-epimerase GalE [bacterium]
MKVFVTGGAGYIGSVCVEELFTAGHEVVVWDNLSEGHKAAVHPRAVFLQGDLLDRDLLLRAVQDHRPGAVIHFAGKALVPESMRDPSVYYRVNVSGGLNLLDAMVAAGCKKIIFSSTCATYGLPERVPMDESTPQKPINPYGHSKLVFEQILGWYAQIHGVIPTCLRYFNAAGASAERGEHHRVETHLIPNVLFAAMGQKPQVEVFGEQHATPDGTCIRDYIHVRDLASAHILALDREQPGFFNVGTGNGYSVRQVVEAARKITKKPKLVAASQKLQRELGWKPVHSSLEQILSSAWDWHQAHPRGYAG